VVFADGSDFTWELALHRVVSRRMDATFMEDARRAPVGLSSYERVVRLLSKPRGALAVAALAFLMSLPALAVGLTADDFGLGFAVKRDPLSAYAFHSRDPVERKSQILALRDAGVLPWWIDPELHQAFMRPLSSLSLALDFTLWPGAPWWMHLENSLLFAALVLLAAGLYRDFGLPSRARGLATFFFAMQAGQSMTVGWISGRNTLLAALFGFLSVRGFIAAQSGKRAHLLGAIVAFAAALLSAEGGAATLAYLFAFALCFGRVPAPVSEAKQLVRPEPSLARRLTALSGFALVVLGWLSAYKLGGYGVKASGFYVDPVHDPLRFTLDLSLAIPIYLASQLTVPISLAILYASRRLWLPWLRLDSRARALGLGALLAILPLGSSLPQDRLVSFSALGMCGIVALIVEERLGLRAEQLPQRGARRLWRLHALWAPLLFVPFLFGSVSMIAGGGAELLDRVLGDDPRPVLLVNAPSALPAQFFAHKREWFGEAHPPVEVLYAGSSAIELTRSADRVLELRVPRGYFFGRFERIERTPSSHPLQLGETIELRHMRVQVIELKDGVPTRVRFELGRSLSEVRVYAWQGRKLEPLTLPARGQSVQIAPASVM
jgi:hypothetical protein